LKAAGVADVDFYRISQKPYSSYEILVDTTSTAIGPTLVVELVSVNTDGSLTTIKASSGTSTLNYTRTLRFSNETGFTNDIQYIRVKSANNGCGGNCSGYDVYRIRAFNTTQDQARFNNAQGQDTYEFIQNPTEYIVTAKMFFFSETG